MGINRVLKIVAGVAFVSFAGQASADLITIDFESPATGSNITSAPLVTTAGTVTVTNGVLYDPCWCSDLPGAQFGQTLTEIGGVTQIDFDFDVFSIMFNYGGGSGNFNGIIYDIASSQLGSFIDPSMVNATIPYAPVTLSSSTAIRSFSFFDTVGGAAVDNLILDTASVPEPTTIALFGLGLAGLGFARRKKV